MRKWRQYKSYLSDPKVAFWKKTLGLLALAYALFPFDGVPDAIPVLGWLDDAGVLAAVATYTLRQIAQHSQSAAVKPVVPPTAPGD
jgi:uncharacterized membrane protein YkvA (DUF1232 family)